MNTLPLLVKNRDLALVEVDGHAVITASDIAKGLDYKDERSVNNIFARNRDAFRDYGIFDLTRVHQIDEPISSDFQSRGFHCETPLSHKFDTALVQFITPSASDGRGGGLQRVRVFTKRGALKICMKSNQSKAIAIQEALIDLYEKVESGQLIGAQRFGRVIKALSHQVTAMQKEITYLKERPALNINLPDDAALPIAVERKRGRSMPFYGAFRFSEVREFVISLRRQGWTYEKISEATKKRWPSDTNYHASKSAVHRFWTKARRGYLKDYGIDITMH